ncbi:MAG: ribonuclease HI [Pirellulaceae bacterium]|jgi:ribonuclease HI
MPKFQCQVCDTTFEIPQETMDKYVDWVPKYCREHVKTANKSGKRTVPQQRFTPQEENLTLAEVLAKYTEGPASGVFTDGSAIPNPGSGGWGVVWVENGEIKEEHCGHEEGETTNNRMELLALINAYEMLPIDAEVTVITDSKLCLDTITNWAYGWESRGWTRKGKPLKNLDLVKPLFELYKAHPNCPLQWIAAHSGFRWNEYADSLSTAWSRAEK